MTYFADSTGGLKASDLPLILDAEQTRREQKYENIAMGCGIASAVIAGVATVAISILTLKNLEYIDVPSKRDPNKTFKQAANQGLLLLGILGLVCGWMLTAAAAGFSVYGICKLIGYYKIDRFAKFKLGLQDSYEKNGLIEPQDIVRLMQAGGKRTRQQLISNMNFEQLLAVKKIMKEKDFLKLLDKEMSEPHRVMKSILSLNHQNTLDKKLKVINSYVIKSLVKQNPFVVEAIEDEIRKENPQNKTILEKEFRQLYNPVYQKKASADDQVKISIVNSDPSKPTVEVQANLSLLTQNSEYLKRALASKGSKSVYELHEENAEGLKLLINILNQENVVLNRNTVFLLSDIANKYNVDSVLHLLSVHILTHPEQFSDEDLCFLIQHYPLLTGFKDHLEKKLLAKKITEKSWQDLTKQAQDSNFIKLKTKAVSWAQTFTRSLLLETPPNPKAIEWFKNCQRVMDPDQFDAFTLAILSENTIKVSNIKLYYQLFEATDSKLLQKKCLEFCQTHQNDLKKHFPWEMHMIPAEIGEIIYPESSQLIANTWNEPKAHGLKAGW